MTNSNNFYTQTTESGLSFANLLQTLKNHNQSHVITQIQKSSKCFKNQSNIKNNIRKNTSDEDKLPKSKTEPQRVQIKQHSYLSEDSSATMTEVKKEIMEDSSENSGSHASECFEDGTRNIFR